MKTPTAIPDRMLCEIPEYEIDLIAQLKLLATQFRHDDPMISDETLVEKLSQAQKFRDFKSWVKARRDIEAAGPSLGLDK
jgi:hypothetical protein